MQHIDIVSVPDPASREIAELNALHATVPDLPAVQFLIVSEALSRADDLKRAGHTVRLFTHERYAALLSELSEQQRRIAALADQQTAALGFG